MEREADQQRALTVACERLEQVEHRWRSRDIHGAPPVLPVTSFSSGTCQWCQARDQHSFVQREPGYPSPSRRLRAANAANKDQR